MRDSQFDQARLISSCLGMKSGHHERLARGHVQLPHRHNGVFVENFARRISENVGDHRPRQSGEPDTEFCDVSGPSRASSRSSKFSHHHHR